MPLTVIAVDGFGVALGGLGVGLGVGFGVGLGVATAGLGVGVGLAVGLGVGLGVAAAGLGVGVANTLVADGVGIGGTAVAAAAAGALDEALYRPYPMADGEGEACSATEPGGVAVPGLGGDVVPALQAASPTTQASASRMGARWARCLSNSVSRVPSSVAA